MTPTEQHLKFYRHNLTENEKLILQLFAFTFISLSVRDIIKVLNNRIPTSDITKAYNSLLRNSLIESKADECRIRKDLALTVLTDALGKKTFVKYIPAMRDIEESRRRTETPYRYLREIVVMNDLHDGKIAQDAINIARYYATAFFEFLEPVCHDAFNWLFRVLGERSLYAMMNIHLLDVHADLQPVHPVLSLEEKIRAIPDVVTEGNSSLMLLSANSMLDGQFEKMETYNKKLPLGRQPGLMTAGIHSLYRGAPELAYQMINNTMGSKKKTEMFVNYQIFYAVYYILSLLGMDAEKYTPEALKMLAKKETTFNYATIIASALLHHALGDKPKTEEAMRRADHFSTSVSNLDKIFLFVAACFTETQLSSIYLPTGEALLEYTTANGYKLLALELSFALMKLYQGAEFKTCYRTLTDELGLTAVLSRRQRVESWEMSLNNLMGVMSAISPAAGKSRIEKETRIIYSIDPLQRLVQPCLQTSTPSGGWTKGRNIALKRLKAMDVDGMTGQDQLIASTLRVYRDMYSSGDNLFFSDDVWPALAGHPYLFMYNNPDIPVELIKEQPAITVTETDKGMVLKTDIEPGDNKFIIHKETNTRYKLINIDSRQRTILQAIRRGAMIIPPEGREKLVQALDSLSNFFTIHSDLVEARKGTHSVESDSRIRVQLLPLGNSLKAELFVKPFGSVPPYCKPGAGGQNIIGMVGSERCHASRDLKTEIRYADAIMQEIQQNTNIDTSQEPIIFDEPRDSLFLLDILSRHQNIAVVEWPEGVRFKVNRSVSMNNLCVEVKGVDYWFELDGSLQIDEDTVLSFKQLLELNARSHGRFIELGQGEFLSLSADLKKRLDELQAYTETAGERTKMSRFASLSLMEIFGQSGSFKSDKKWAEFQEQLARSKEIEPVTPKTLKAELRPYQEEGFRWMVRLSEWGAGACLADDMGLGKTVQALTILLHRAKMGAALVVCPASVVPNWVSETNRFAPTLNVVLLTPANRKETLEKADAFDLVITTYGLLQSEDELFANEKWATAILDEAHAIKNYHTKTSKAAMNLNADFRLVMTGTPVQNHLGEVWNLFHFINPGLLGTMQRFNDRYVKTGETGSKRLKKLLAPFILRRTKNSVLEELPPKTEITTQVELSDDERVFYETLRRQAIENLQKATGPAGQQHVKALAEITRLRLACCHPDLIEPDINIQSSKLATFLEIVDDLRGNNHRALVFSQFVKHLTIVRQKLDEKNIKYKYLDGSTPIAERERNVRDFQAGDGELFLISLKAGGLGLNLTAADYVIHLDPWWNPAIEDQASDRTHRIGQKRPVTIYRLVTQHTIEEKIIQLHHTKRDIADTLLEGTDAPSKLSTEELLRLIME